MRNIFAYLGLSVSPHGRFIEIPTVFIHKLGKFFKHNLLRSSRPVARINKAAVRRKIKYFG